MNDEPTLLDHERDQMLTELQEKHVEIFWMSKEELDEHDWRDEDGDQMLVGWYSWICHGCSLPDTEPLYHGRQSDPAIHEAWNWYIGDLD